MIFFFCIRSFLIFFKIFGISPTPSLYSDSITVLPSHLTISSNLAKVVVFVVVGGAGGGGSSGSGNIVIVSVCVCVYIRQHRHPHQHHHQH